MTKWVTEYHYENGDVGVHPHDHDGPWLDSFTASGAPSHIVIRPDTDAGQALSTRMREASRVVCKLCAGKRYVTAFSDGGRRAIERCGNCSLSMTNGEAVALFLREVYADLDEWFEGDEKERTAHQMLDTVRSMLSWVAGQEASEHASDCAINSAPVYDPRPCDCGKGEDDD